MNHESRWGRGWQGRCWDRETPVSQDRNPVWRTCPLGICPWKIARLESRGPRGIPVVEVMEEFRHRGWHSRGYLPHFDAANEIQAITFRLADSLPAEVVEAWKSELAASPSSGKRPDRILRERIAKYEDAGRGSCVLANPECAEVVQAALLHFDGERYRLLEWCIMPNHVHLLVHCLPGTPLGTIIRSWKNFSAREINRLLGQEGALWAVDYHDRYIRDLDHLANASSYIRSNPVKAGLCARPEDWPWSSAGWRTPGGRDSSPAPPA